MFRVFAFIFGEILTVGSDFFHNSRTEVSLAAFWFMLTLNSSMHFFRCDQLNTLWVVFVVFIGGIPQVGPQLASYNIVEGEVLYGASPPFGWYYANLLQYV